MRHALLPALLPVVLAPLLLAGPAAASVAPPSPTPTASPSDPDPCAPVDGVPPLMCQSGVPAGQAPGLPLTGAPAGAAAGALVVVGAALVLRRRTAV